MANPYGALFKAPGSVAFSAAGFVGRMPVSMTGIGIITMLSQMNGEYGLAGAVSAAFTLSMALCGPQVSRIVDRKGQSKVLLPAAGLSVISMAGLLLCAHYRAPVWTLFVFAILAGTLPNMAAMVRARWTHVYRDSSKLHTAFSLESVVDEMTFVVGPALSVALSTSLFAEAGPMIASALLAIGVLLLVPQKRTEPAVHVGEDGGPAAGSAIRIGALQLLALILAAGGTIVGTVDVVSVAFAEEQGAPASAGIVLSVYAVGSALAGLVFGARKLKTPLPRLLTFGAAGTAVTALPLLLVGNVATLSVAVFFSGIFFAPTMIIVMGLVEKIVPARQLTEGMTWAITGLSVGTALGAAVSGSMVDRFGPTGGFAVAMVAGAATLLLALVAYRPLTHGIRRACPEEAPVSGAEGASVSGAEAAAASKTGDAKDGAQPALGAGNASS
ncbi:MULTISPECIES: MFS transporter [Streptomyces]|uniref:MFS transporter n=3 Tax=Streptomyces rimosus TaxID=1927 RepID=L8ES93_STRR1|nr:MULTISPECIES: MFS transporter [Streptomyces]KOG82236.1 MFS transporter [Kitasatospora aureofaciens]MYT47516.1 MFS transporter [Streptomyces sp. SID5471]KUJ43180.1 MFS transporter [Streptomyces rimosus subsp. rimosus]QDA10372.1 MFS transporter [Streptomyces rimosus]QGY70978.1 MFS transporter [Streptomyces rimosus R6-500]